MWITRKRLGVRLCNEMELPLCGARDWSEEDRMMCGDVGKR
jgi:hypothetical protein